METVPVIPPQCVDHAVIRDMPSRDSDGDSDSDNDSNSDNDSDSGGDSDLDGDSDDFGSLPCCTGLQPWLEEKSFVSLEAKTKHQQSIQLTIKHLQGHIRALRHRYNTFSSIHRLPPEILMEIFALVQPSHALDIRLMHVCQVWRALLTRTPEFWAYMLVACPLTVPQATLRIPRWWGTFLKRTGSTPLRLTLPGFSPLLRDALVPHMHHICSLRLHLTVSQASALYTMLTLGLPLLESLLLTHDKPSLYSYESLDDESFRTIHCSDQALPRLRTLTLPFTFLTRGISVVSLHDVTISGCLCSQCESRINRRDLDVVSLFARCPSLENLRFENVGDVQMSSLLSPSTSVGPIALTNLQTLAFVDIHTPHLLELLDRLMLSPCTLVTVDVPYTREFEPGLQEALRKLPAFSAIDRLESQFCAQSTTPFILHCLSGQSLRFVLRTTQPRERVTNNVGYGIYMGPKNVLNHDMIKMFLLPTPSLAITTLKLWGMPFYSDLKDTPEIPDYETVLASFPHLAVLKLRLEEHEFDFLDRFLQLTPDSDAGTRVCPALHTLDISWKTRSLFGASNLEYSSEQLKTALEERARRGSPLRAFSLTCKCNRRSYRKMSMYEEEVEKIRKQWGQTFATAADEVTVYARVRAVEL